MCDSSESIPAGACVGRPARLKTAMTPDDLNMISKAFTPNDDGSFHIFYPDLERGSLNHTEEKQLHKSSPQWQSFVPYILSVRDTAVTPRIEKVLFALLRRALEYHCRCAAFDSLIRK